MKVGLYLRVSTQEQAKEGYSIGEQEERLRNYCKAMDWKIAKVYIDPGYSGGDTNRPGLQDIVKDVKEGALDKVVVYKLDRLSRSQLDTLYLIEKVFLANGTDFVSMSENFDTSTPFGRAMIGILAVFAQLEREQIKERMSMGKEARAKEGKWHGGSTPPIGYDYDKGEDILRINEYETMQVRELFDLFVKGTPLRSIETMFYRKGYKHKHGVWSTKAMRRVLGNKVYIGYMSYNGQYYKAMHDPIIDKIVFDKAQQLLKERADNYNATGSKAGIQTTYLGGLLYCKHCGGKYAKDAQKQRGGKPDRLIYTCYSRSKRMRQMIKDPNCKNKIWTMSELDNAVFEEIRQLAMDPDYIRNARADKADREDTPNKVAILQTKIKELDEQISRFMDLYGIGKFTIDQVSGKIDPLNEERAKLEKELENLVGESGGLTEAETIEIVKSFEEILSRGQFEEIRRVIELLIYYIELDDDKVTIHWKFL